MPIYEYRCQSCNAVSEKLVRNGKEPTECPECGAEALTRLISRAGIIFKGSGFYVTDTKSTNAGTSSSTTETNKSSEGSSSGESSSKSEGKSSTATSD